MFWYVSKKYTHNVAHQSSLVRKNVRNLFDKVCMYFSGIDFWWNI